MNARVSKNCNKVNLTGFQHGIVIFALLGIATFISGLIMSFTFIGEQAEIIPFWGIIYIQGISDGDNIILFIASFITMIFLAILILWFIYRGYRVKKCQKTTEFNIPDIEEI